MHCLVHLKNNGAVLLLGTFCHFKQVLKKIMISPKPERDISDIENPNGYIDFRETDSQKEINESEHITPTNHLEGITNAEDKSVNILIDQLLNGWKIKEIPRESINPLLDILQNCQNQAIESNDYLLADKYQILISDLKKLQPKGENSNVDMKKIPKLIEIYEKELANQQKMLIDYENEINCIQEHVRNLRFIAEEKLFENTTNLLNEISAKRKDDFHPSKKLLDLQKQRQGCVRMKNFQEANGIWAKEKELEKIEREIICNESLKKFEEKEKRIKEDQANQMLRIQSFYENRENTLKQRVISDIAKVKKTIETLKKKVMVLNSQSSE